MPELARQLAISTEGGFALGRLWAVNVLQADLVLFPAFIQYRDGVAVCYTHHFARELKGLGCEGGG